MKYYVWNSIYYCMWNSCLLVFLLLFLLHTRIFNSLAIHPPPNKISKAWKFAGSRRGPGKGHHIEARADWGEPQIRAPCCGGDMGLRGRIKPKAGLKSERIGLCLAYFKSVYFVKGIKNLLAMLWPVILSYCFYFLFVPLDWHLAKTLCKSFAHFFFQPCSMYGLSSLGCSVSGPLKLARYCRKLQMKKAALQQNCSIWYYILLYINII